MKNVRAPLATVILGAVLAACSDSSPAVTASARAHFDGGSGFGSGHRISSDGTSTSATTSPTEMTASDSITVERNGSGFGSGH